MSCLLKVDHFRLNKIFFDQMAVLESQKIVHHMTFPIFIKFRRFETFSVGKMVFTTVLSIQDVFLRLENSIFPPYYTIYGKVLREQNYLFKKDLQIYL